MSLVTLPNEYTYRGEGVQCHWVRNSHRCDRESAPSSLFCYRHLNTPASQGAARQIRLGGVLQQKGKYGDAWKRNYDDPDILNARAEVALAQAVLEADTEHTDFEDARQRVQLLSQTKTVIQAMSQTLALEIERGTVMTLAEAKVLALGLADDVNRLVSDPATRRALLEAFGNRFAQVVPSNYEEASYRKELEVAAAPPYYVEAEHA